MAGPRERFYSGQRATLYGLARNGQAITASDATVYDPPLTRLRITGVGTVVIVLDGDDESDSAKRFTLTMAANSDLTGLLIRQVRAASTATGIIGFS